MNRIRLLLFAALAALVIALPLNAQPRSVTVLHVADTHSHLDGTGARDAALKSTIGGLARATTLINQQRELAENVILLHAGDVFQGDLFFNFTFGGTELQWLHDMKFDAIALGNHDLDFGPAYLAQIAGPAFGETPVPFLSANAKNPSTYGLGALVRSSLAKQFGEIPSEEGAGTGVLVGVIGLTVPDDPMCQAPEGMLDPRTLDIAKREVASLISQGAEIIILLSHMGLPQDELLGQAVEGIDLIISGHSHVTLDKPIEVSASNGRRKCYIVASSPNYANVGRTVLELWKSSARVTSYTLLPVDQTVTPDPVVEAEVEELKAEIEAFYGPVFSRQIGETSREFSTRPTEGSRFRDTVGGNFVADALRFAGQTDIGLTTAGLISEGLPAGPIVAADLFRAVSYGFDETTGLGLGVVTAKITGAQLLNALDVSVGGLEPDDPFFPSVSGMSFKYSPSGAPIMPAAVKVGEDVLDPSRTYTITMNAAAASFCPLLGIELTDVTVLPGVFEYNALVNYVEALHGQIEAPAVGRIRALKEWSLFLPEHPE